MERPRFSMGTTEKRHKKSTQNIVVKSSQKFFETIATNSGHEPAVGTQLNNKMSVNITTTIATDFIKKSRNIFANVPDRDIYARSKSSLLKNKPQAVEN